MTFPVNGILDDFDRANEGPPMTGWDDLIAGLVVSSNVAAVSAGGLNASYWLTIMTDADCEVYATIASNPASNRSMYVMARIADIAAPSFDGYALKFNKLAATDTLQIIRIDNGIESVLGANFTQELTAGNKFGLGIVGTTLTAYVDTGSGWTSLGSRTDGIYSAAGYLGLGIASGTLNDFGGGGLAAAGGGQPPRTMHQMRMRRN